MLIFDHISLWVKNSYFLFHSKLFSDVSADFSSIIEVLTKTTHFLTHQGYFIPIVSEESEITY